MPSTGRHFPNPRWLSHDSWRVFPGPREGPASASAGHVALSWLSWNSALTLVSPAIQLSSSCRPFSEGFSGKTPPGAQGEAGRGWGSRVLWPISTRPHSATSSIQRRGGPGVLGGGACATEGAEARGSRGPATCPRTAAWVTGCFLLEPWRAPSQAHLPRCAQHSGLCTVVWEKTQALRSPQAAQCFVGSFSFGFGSLKKFTLGMKKTSRRHRGCNRFY